MNDQIDNLTEAIRYCDQCDTQCKQYKEADTLVKQAQKEVNKWKRWKDDPVHLLLIFAAVAVFAIVPASMIAIFFPKTSIIVIVGVICLATGLIFLTIWRTKIISKKLTKANDKLDNTTKQRIAKVTDLMNTQSKLMDLTREVPDDLRHSIAMSFMVAYITKTGNSISQAEHEYRETLEKVKFMDSDEAKKLYQDNLNSVSHMNERNKIFKLINEK